MERVLLTAPAEEGRGEEEGGGGEDHGEETHAPPVLKEVWVRHTHHTVSLVRGKGQLEIRLAPY